jgi:hypothetical protein
MASQEIKFEMKHLNESGEYDSLYPKTLSTITIVSDDAATKVGLSANASVDEAIKELAEKIKNTEIWEFTLEDDSIVRKEVVIG